MARYSLESLKEKMSACISFVQGNKLDILTYAFWVFSYLMYYAAQDLIIDGEAVVNAAATGNMFAYAIPAYRNAYAHTEKLDELESKLKLAVSVIDTSWTDNEYIHECLAYIVNYDFGGEEE